MTVTERRGDGRRRSETVEERRGERRRVVAGDGRGKKGEVAGIGDER